MQVGHWIFAGSSLVVWLAACGITLEVRPDDDADASAASSGGSADGSAARDATSSSSSGATSSSGAACSTQIAQATACADKPCGKANDGCQGTYDCEDRCATADEPNARCVPGSNTCTCQQSACPGGYQCGEAPSGCGAPRTCGECSEVAVCNPQRHVCECTLYTCGNDCFNYHDCSPEAQLDCECNAPAKCIVRYDNSNRVCCPPLSFDVACGGGAFANEAICRFRSDGCGGFFDCGQCPANQHCQLAAANFCVPD